jgi:hypothetical protein
MRMSLRLFLSTALLAVALGVALSPQSASAEENPVHTYFAGVNQLLPEVDAWQADLDAALSAMIAKPELACGDDVAALARRGHGIVEDLRGTGELAPSVLQARHEASVDALEQAVFGLQAMLESCDRNVGADEIAAGNAEYAKAIRLIRYYSARIG